MSDYDDGEGGDIEFEFESDNDFDDEGDEEAIQIENTFYEAEDIKFTRPEEALSQFERVVDLVRSREQNGDGGSREWEFKALQNVVILCGRLGRYDEMVSKYAALLNLTGKVTRNEASDAINLVLDGVFRDDRRGEEELSGGTSKQLEEIYSLTLKSLQDAHNDRLWFTTTVRLAKLLLQQGRVSTVQRLLKDLHQKCQTAEGNDDVAGKASQLLEVYALDVQLCAETRNTVRMREIYPRTLSITSAVVDPRSVAVVRECGGKMYMNDKKWELAYNEFFEAFKNYQEIGNTKKSKAMLRYVVLANILTLSDINPFDSREAKAYQDDPEISVMHRLRTFFDKNDIKSICRLINDPANHLLDDPVISSHLHALLHGIRQQVVLSVVKPFTRVRLDFIAESLCTTREEVIPLLINCILDGKICGVIDEITGYLVNRTTATTTDPGTQVGENVDVASNDMPSDLQERYRSMRLYAEKVMQLVDPIRTWKTKSRSSLQLFKSK